MSRCSCGSVTPMLAASMAPSTVSAFPESAPALADDLGLASALLHVFQDHVALEHVEDLVGGIDVEVSARIRAADESSISRGDAPHFFTRGQPPSCRGRNACSLGIVATIFARSHSLFDSSGVFACIRYMSRITRPSSRMRPFLVMKSLIGSSFILAMTAFASSVPAALTALRKCRVAP